jgi:hypothetical protein
MTRPLDENLRTFLDAHPSHYEGRDDWPLDPVAPLRVRLCLASSLPPPAWRSSILAIVALADETVLFLQPTAPSGAIAHYPDFLQAVYAATAARYDSRALLPDEIPCEPVDARWAVAVTETAQRPLLRAALRASLS